MTTKIKVVLSGFVLISLYSKYKHICKCCQIFAISIRFTLGHQRGGASMHRTWTKARPVCLIQAKPSA